MYRDDFSCLELPDDAIRQVRCAMSLAYCQSYTLAKWGSEKGLSPEAIRATVRKALLVGPHDGLDFEGRSGRPYADGIADALAGRKMTVAYGFLTSPEEING